MGLLLATRHNELPEAYPNLESQPYVGGQSRPAFLNECRNHSNKFCWIYFGTMQESACLVGGFLAERTIEIVFHKSNVLGTRAQKDKDRNSAKIKLA